MVQIYCLPRQAGLLVLICLKSIRQNANPLGNPPKRTRSPCIWRSQKSEVASGVETLWNTDRESPAYFGGQQPAEDTKNRTEEKAPSDIVKKEFLLQRASARERERQKIASQEDLLAFSLVKNKSPINDLSRLVKILSRLLTQEAFCNMKRHLFLYLVPLSNTEKTIMKKI